MADGATVGVGSRREPWSVRVPVFHLGVTLASLVVVACCGTAALSFVAGCPECVRHQALREGMMSVPGVALEVRQGAELLLRGGDGTVGGSCLAQPGTRATTTGSDATWGPAARVVAAGTGVVARVPLGMASGPACEAGAEGYLRDYDDWSVVPEPSLRDDRDRPARGGRAPGSG